MDYGDLLISIVANVMAGLIAGIVIAHSLEEKPKFNKSTYKMLIILIIFITMVLFFVNWLFRNYINI